MGYIERVRYLLNEKEIRAGINEHFLADIVRDTLSEGRTSRDFILLNNMIFLGQPEFKVDWHCELVRFCSEFKLVCKYSPKWQIIDFYYVG